MYQSVFEFADDRTILMSGRRGHLLAGTNTPPSVITEEVRTPVSDVYLLVVGETGGWHSGLLG